MIALCLSATGFKKVSIPTIEDKFKNIPLLKEEISRIPDVTFVAAFREDGWLLSDFQNEAHLLKLESYFKEATDYEKQ